MNQLQQWMWFTNEAKSHEERRFWKDIARQISQEKWLKPTDITSDVVQSYWYQWQKLQLAMLWVCDIIAEFYGMWLWELDHEDAKERFGISDLAYKTLRDRSDWKKQLGSYLYKKWWIDPETKERKIDTLTDEDKQKALQITNAQTQQWLDNQLQSQ